MELLRNKNDFHTSVERALDEIDPKWREYEGLIITGTHSPEDVEEKIEKIKWFREGRKPFLGICFGMQLMLVEYARNVLGLKMANSVEVNPKTPHPIFIKMSDLRVGIKPVEWEGQKTEESHWHNYFFNGRYFLQFSNNWDMSFTEKVLEVARLKNHPHMLGTQYHPEYQSSKDKSHLILQKFLRICRKKHELEK